MATNISLSLQDSGPNTWMSIRLYGCNNIWPLQEITALPAVYAIPLQSPKAQHMASMPQCSGVCARVRASARLCVHILTAVARLPQRSQGGIENADVSQDVREANQRRKASQIDARSKHSQHLEQCLVVACHASSVTSELRVYHGRCVPMPMYQMCLDADVSDVSLTTRAGTDALVGGGTSEFIIADVSPCRCNKCVSMPMYQMCL